jgi:hypothetical protein
MANKWGQVSRFYIGSRYGRAHGCGRHIPRHGHFAFESFEGDAVLDVVAGEAGEAGDVGEEGGRVPADDE